MEDSSRPIILKNILGPHCNYDTLDWKPFRKGIEIVRIYGTPYQGPSAALLRYGTGAELPHHSHTGYEHILVLAGSQVDGNGHHAQGTLIINQPGSGHSVLVEHGCIVLAIWEHPVVFSNLELERKTAAPAAPIAE